MQNQTYCYRRRTWKLCDEERGRLESEEKAINKQYKINKVKMGYQESVNIFVFALVSSPAPCNQSHKSWYYSLYVIKDTNLMCSQTSLTAVLERLVVQAALRNLLEQMLEPAFSLKMLFTRTPVTLTDPIDQQQDLQGSLLAKDLVESKRLMPSYRDLC